MGRGPYEPSLKRFVECLDGKVEKDKPYTYEELERICNQWYDTIRDYSSFRLSDVNAELEKRGKKVTLTTVTKEICQKRAYPGLIVDPQRSNDGLPVGIAFLKFMEGLLEGMFPPKSNIEAYYWER
jgi:hypothetical protein